MWGGGYKTHLPDSLLRPQASAIVEEMRKTAWDCGILHEKENADNPIGFANKLSSILSNQTPILVTLDEAKHAPINLTPLYSEFRLSPEDIVAVSGALMVSVLCHG